MTVTRRCSKAASRSAPRTRRGSGVAVLDLDGFKQINDICGHAAGDVILKEVAYRLQKELRSHDLIYRLGGDEFLILLPGGDLADARRNGLRVRSITGSVSADPRVSVTAAVRVSASCGVSASVRGEPFDFRAVSGSADRALCKAKQDGKGLPAWRASVSKLLGAGACIGKSWEVEQGAAEIGPPTRCSPSRPSSPACIDSRCEWRSFGEAADKPRSAASATDGACSKAALCASVPGRICKGRQPLDTVVLSGPWQGRSGLC